MKGEDLDTVLLDLEDLRKQKDVRKFLREKYGI